MDPWVVDHSPENIESAKGRLATYVNRVEKLAAIGTVKPDLIANKELKDTLRPEDSFGEIPGVLVGTEFNNRGELAILGLHTQILKGIMCKNNEPRGAHAIVLSGGYQDDEDGGTEFWYTGSGGRDHKSGLQVADQEWTRDNLALRNNHETGTPVRVIRGSKANKVLKYTYDGLYIVREAVLQVNSSGYKVCRFKLVGVPGHSVASMQVKFGATKWQVPPALKPRQRLVKEEEEEDVHVKRRKRQPKGDGLGTGGRLQRELLLQSVKSRPHLVAEDISLGREVHVPIPAFNEVDDEPLPDGLQYEPDYTWGHGVYNQDMQAVMAMLDEALAQHLGGSLCGVSHCKMIHNKDKAMAARYSDKYKRMADAYYTRHGLLWETDTCGVYECPATCQSSACAMNQVVTEGIKLPLEVFKTVNRGWGVRCPTPIKAGSFICCYIGTLKLDAAIEADDSNAYIYDLSHFAHMYTEIAKEAAHGQLELPPHRLPPAPPPTLEAARLAAAAAAASKAAAAEAAAAAATASAAGPIGEVVAEAHPEAVLAVNTVAGAHPASHVCCQPKEQAAPAASGQQELGAQDSSLAPTPTASSAPPGHPEAAPHLLGGAPDASTGVHCSLGPRPGSPPEAESCSTQTCQSSRPSAAAAADGAGDGVALGQPQSSVTQPLPALEQVMGGDRDELAAAADLPLQEPDLPLQAGADPPPCKSTQPQQPVCSLPQPGCDQCPLLQPGEEAQPAELGIDLSSSECQPAEQAQLSSSPGPSSRPRRGSRPTGPSGRYSTRQAAGAAAKPGDAPAAATVTTGRGRGRGRGRGAGGGRGRGRGAAGAEAADTEEPWPELQMLAEAGRAGQEWDSFLSVDARTVGNVARFINSSCKPNCIPQVVFAKNARNVCLYYTAFFALVDIPPMEELTYNYGSLYKIGDKPEICRCGHPECEGSIGTKQAQARPQP